MSGQQLDGQPDGQPGGQPDGQPESRSDGRQPDQLRPVTFERHYTRYAAGSVLASCGHTKVLCTVSIQPGVPRFLEGSGKGWLTAEYRMLPSATH
ncbi:MAG: hypothetical protein F6K16_42240, partial [Symploca sp. SIO2B6]|nr:hypothetical protein [Symploca sp. SIO2B6]